MPLNGIPLSVLFLCSLCFLMLNAFVYGLGSTTAEVCWIVINCAFVLFSVLKCYGEGKI
jgi:hypothetical protein